MQLKSQTWSRRATAIRGPTLSWCALTGHLLLAGCSDSQPDAHETSSVTGSTESDSAPSELPAGCEFEVSPFLSGECLQSLRDACNALQEANTCVAAMPFLFDGYTIRCEWAKLVEFGDPAACEVVNISGSCEATVPNTPCASCSDGGLQTSVNALPDNRIISVCGGPLGPWSQVGSTMRYLDPCRVSGADQGDNPLCVCADEACEAM